MKNKFKVKSIIYLALILVPVTAAAYTLVNNKRISDGRIYIYDKEQPIAVNTKSLQLQQLTEEYIFSGTFEPNRETKVSAATQGQIESLPVEVGTLVKKGDVLVYLDDTMLKLQLKEAEINIESLRKDVERFTILAQADAVQGVQLEKLVAGLETAQVKRELLLDQISKSTVRAPFGGIITAKLNEAGGFAAPGVPLVQITDITNLRFSIFVHEKQLAFFIGSREYKITADAFPGVDFSGKVIMVGSKSFPGNSYAVEFLVENTPDLKIKAGMFGKVYVTDAAADNQIVIPTSAISSVGEQALVYIVREGKAEQLPVEVARHVGSNSIISKGLNAGDELITRGFINLFNGASVINN